MRAIHELLRPTKKEWRRIRETNDFEAVRRGYNARAERLSPEEPNPGQDAIAAHLERLGITKNASILDAGCGSGGVCRALLARGYENLSAFDISDAHIASVAAFIPNAWCGVCESIDRPNQSYDVVISNLVIEHCMNPLLALAEMYRILKPGGLLYITTDNAWWSDLVEIRNWVTRPSRRNIRASQPIDGDFTAREFESMLTGRGFKVQETFFLGGFPWGERVLCRILGRPTTEIPGIRYFATRFGFIARREDVAEEKL